MIGMKGQWYLEVQIEGLPADFIDGRNFISAELVEEVGNIIPTFRLSFYMEDLALLNTYVNEGARIRLELGKDKDDPNNSPYVMIVRSFKNAVFYDTQNKGGDKAVVTMHGTHDGLQYFSQLVRSFPGMPSANVMASVAANDGIFTGYDSNIGASDDAMTWVQHGTATRAFLSHVWLHSFVNSDNFQCLGITGPGKLKFMNIPTLSQQPPRWYFTQIPANEEAYLPLQPPSTTQRSATSGASVASGLATPDVQGLSNSFNTQSNGLLRTLRNFQLSNQVASSDRSLQSLMHSIEAAKVDPPSFASGNNRLLASVTLQRYVADNRMTKAELSDILSSISKMESTSNSMKVAQGNQGAPTNYVELIEQSSPLNVGSPTSLILYNDVGIAGTSGLFNLLSGTDRVQPEYELETELEEDLKPVSSPLFSEQFQRSIEMRLVERKHASRMRNRNHHVNFLRSFAEHRTKLLQFSCMSAVMHITDAFDPYEILHVSNIVVRDSLSNVASISAHSGNWMISKVVRAVHANRLATTIWFNREGLSPGNTESRLG